MINLISGGHWIEKGYCYTVYMTHPEFSNSRTINMFGGKHKCFKFSFPTEIVLTRNSIYFNIVVRVFGFGIGLEIQSKS